MKKIIHPNVNIYEGELKDGEYEGECKENKKSGKGLVTYKDGRKFK
jgi:hypothetical protein